MDGLKIVGGVVVALCLTRIAKKYLAKDSKKAPAGVKPALSAGSTFAPGDVQPIGRPLFPHMLTTIVGGK